MLQPLLPQWPVLRLRFVWPATAPLDGLVLLRIQPTEVAGLRRMHERINLPQQRDHEVVFMVGELGTRAG